MSSAHFVESLSVAQAVAVGRLQATRHDERSAPAPGADNPAFADTAPLWFRSEAFAEDVTDPVPAAANGPALPGRDAQMLAAGAAVLRMTLQALQLQRR